MIKLVALAEPPSFKHFCYLFAKNMAGYFILEKEFNSIKCLTPGQLHERILHDKKLIPHDEYNFMAKLKWDRLDLYSTIINTPNGLQWLNQQIR